MTDAFIATSKNVYRNYTYFRKGCQENQDGAVALGKKLWAKRISGWHRVSMRRDERDGRYWKMGGDKRGIMNEGKILWRNLPSASLNHQ
jgi:hypothetical protein